MPLPLLRVVQEIAPLLAPQIGSVVIAKVLRRTACTRVCVVATTRVVLMVWWFPMVHHQVVKVNPRFASVLILCCDDQVLREQYKGIIRYAGMPRTHSPPSMALMVVRDRTPAVRKMYERSTSTKSRFTRASDRAISSRPKWYDVSRFNNNNSTATDV